MNQKDNETVNKLFDTVRDVERVNMRQRAARVCWDKVNYSSDPQIKAVAQELAFAIEGLE